MYVCVCVCDDEWHAFDKRQSSVCVLQLNLFRLKLSGGVDVEDHDDSRAVIIEVPQWLKERKK